MNDAEKLQALLEALQTEMIINQALIDVLVDKGVLSHDELQAKIKQIRIESGIILSGSGHPPAIDAVILLGKNCWL